MKKIFSLICLILIVNLVCGKNNKLIEVRSLTESDFTVVYPGGASLKPDTLIFQKWRIFSPYKYSYQFNLPDSVSRIELISDNGSRIIKKDIYRLKRNLGKREYFQIVLIDPGHSGYDMTPRERRLKFKEVHNNKGKMYFTLGFPYGNFHNFYLKDYGGKRNTKGFIGFSAGIDYHYSNKKSISAEGSVILDSEVPMGPVDYEGWQLSVHRFIVEVGDNFHLKHFSFGYGVNYSYRVWRQQYWGGGEDRKILYPTLYDRRSALGLSANGYWKMAHGVKLGFIYRPYMTLSNSSKYEHSVSIDLKFDINLGRRLARTF